MILTGSRDYLFFLSLHLAYTIMQMNNVDVPWIVRYT
jgi:hypothetical protein